VNKLSLSAVIGFLLLFPIGSFARQSQTLVASQPADEPAAAPSASQRPAGRSSGTFGVGVDVSSLGIGGQFAVKVLQRANARIGFNLFNYSHTLSSDGIAYAGTLNLRSVSANFDYFLVSSLHISPGVLLYNGNNVTANAAVPGGHTFTVGGTTYESGATSPIAGTGELNMSKIAPELLIGFGNLIPRGRRHWGIEAEVGAAYQGAPRVSLALTGLACVPPSSAGPACVNAATDPTVQSNIASQQAKFSHDVSVFRFYPVVSLGFSYSF
jgi:hypothetical protein